MLLNKLPDWLYYIILLIIVLYSIINIKKLFQFIIIGFFGENKTPTYKEFTGVLGFAGIFIMLLKHFIDSTYKPDLELLLFCGGIVLTMSGLDRVLNIFDKYISNKYSNKSNNKNEDSNEIL